jgi:hypothetical protein
MMASWHMREREEHKIFVRSLEILFATYPPSVTAAVTSPLTGIQCREEFLKFPPTHAQIRKELEREMEIFRRNAVRHQVLRVAKEEPLSTNRPTMDELRAKYPDLLSKDRGDRISERRQTFRSLSEIAKECGVSPDQIAALPNAPKK